MGVTIISGTSEMPPKKFVEHHAMADLGEGRRLVDVSVRGNVAYCAVRCDKSNGTSCVVVLLEKRDGGWGFKTISESENPYYYDCPGKILNKLSEPTCLVASKWRNKCRERIELAAAQRRKRDKIRYGSVVTFDDPITFSDGVTESVFACVTHYIGVRNKKLFLRRSDKVLCHIGGLSNRSYSVD